jgi:hypothetical protein
MVGSNQWSQIGLTLFVLRSLFFFITDLYLSFQNQKQLLDRIIFFIDDLVVSKPVYIAIWNELFKLR